MTIFNRLIAALRAILNQLTAAPAPALAGAYYSEAQRELPRDPPTIWEPDPNESQVRAPQLGIVSTQPKPDDHELFVRVHRINKRRKALGVTRVELTRSAWLINSKPFAYEEAPIAEMEAKLKLMERLAHFAPLRDKAGLTAITLQEHAWCISSVRYDYTESTINPFAERMILVQRLRYFHVLRKVIGLAPVTYRENEWILVGRTFELNNHTVTEFEARMRELLRLHQPIEHLSARLIAIGRLPATYTEAGLHVRCGGHTHHYTDEGFAQAEAEVADMERPFLQHAADVAAGRQAFSDFATRGGKLPEPWKLHITLEGDDFAIDGTERLSLAKHRELAARVTQMENNANIAKRLQSLTADRWQYNLPAITLGVDSFSVAGETTPRPYTGREWEHFREETRRAKANAQRAEAQRLRRQPRTQPNMHFAYKDGKVVQVQQLAKTK